MSKRYKVGYMAGVYDLFHIGHLNLITSAKQQCEYLMVGVLTDDEVVRWKKNLPFVPFVERYRDVDEVIKVTSDNIARLESWNRYRFDCQFSGSDYENDPGWLKDRKELQKRGSDIVFLPYTESTSSTKLKELIKRRLI